MMLVPRRNNFGMLDDFFDDDFFGGRRERNLMKTDIREKKDKYIVDIDLPGFNKENISISLNNGYLNIHAKEQKENKNEEEKFIHQERFYGECSRSFYVGDDIKEEDINAEFKNGTLRIDIPKKEEQKKLPQAKHIEIK